MIRWLRAALIYARSFPYIPQEQVDWTPGDESEAEHWFSKGTGKKLLIRLENYAANMAIESCQTGDLRQCNIAGGAGMQIAAIKSHFPPSQSASAKPETSTDQAAEEGLEFSRLNLA